MNLLKTRLREFKLAGMYNNLEERLTYAKDRSLGYSDNKPFEQWGDIFADNLG